MATAVKRGCGTRVKGGIYAEVPMGPGGKPVEFFLVDPPKRADFTALGVTPIGVKLVTINGVAHVLDWIGSTHYPNVIDFVEEAKAFGVSRRLPKTLDFSRLGPESRLILVHARAWILNRDAYYDATVWKCPKEMKEHFAQPLKGLTIEGMCAGLWWQDYDVGDETLRDGVTGEPTADRSKRQILVDFPRPDPQIRFLAGMRPKGIVPKYEPAVFASFPLVKIAVVRDPDDMANEEEALAAASKSALPIVLEDD
jgi:hypothetical protein